MKRTPWFKTTREGRRIMFSNIKGKISEYVVPLGIDSVEEDKVLMICDAFAAIDTYYQNSKVTMQALKEWRDMVYENELGSHDAPPPPAFGTFTAPPLMFCGLFDEFRKMVDQWKSADGYTLAIGEDLMIVGSVEPPVPENTSPGLTLEVKPDYGLKIHGKMKGMSAVRLEYQRKGGSGFQFVDTLTTLPAEIEITPALPGTPESGLVRAIFMKKNQTFGDYSPNYPVTLSE